MKPFSLLIKPASADCNLRCEYCFYLGKCALYPAARHRMADDVLERMVSSFMATGQEAHAFAWQGGEPSLMGVDFYRKVTALQEKYGRQGGLVSNGFQTNGTLIDDAFAGHMAKYKFLVGISIDGPPEVHDRYRKYVDGRGAHAAVMKGLDALRRNGVEHNVLTLVSRSNVGKPVEIYRYLRDHGVMFHQYIECVEFDEGGKLMPFAIGGGEWGDFLCAVFDEWRKNDTRRVSVRLFDSIMNMMVYGVPNACPMGTDCRQYLVVEHNGDIYPCDFFVEKKWRLGNIMDGEWSGFLDSPLYAEFGRRKVAWNAECSGCEYLKYCAGCCPKNRPGQGSDPGRLSILCEGWKKFYHHALKDLRALSNEVAAGRRDAGVVGSRGGIAGRNDPCPCGSGKKFKKCCGRA